MGLWRTRRRQRAGLIAPRAPHLRPRHTARTRRHIPLSEGLTARTGGAGQTILRAIVPGERDPLTLAPCRHPAGKSSTDGLANALTGTWRAEPVFMRPQALACVDGSPPPRAAGEAQSERPCAVMKPRLERDEPPSPWPRGTPGAPSQHQPRAAARAHLARLTGVALAAVTGPSASVAQTILSEVGTDMQQCPTSKPCGSGRGFAPHHDISGGRVLRTRALKVGSRATHAVRQAAQAVARASSPRGASFRARRARLGPQQATVATAHKSGRVVYQLLTSRPPFTAASAATDERQRRARALTHRRRRAHTRGYTFTPGASACILRGFSVGRG